jgi:6,7-dimethyl-8-ribityllumazine synthase
MLKFSSLRFAMITSRFNEEVCLGLQHGALEFLKEQGIEIATEDRYRAPGAFEMPLLAQQLAKTKRYAGIICLGCVIKGDTAHFEFISLGATVGTMQAMLHTETPISFGILTTYTDEQAHVRSRTQGPAQIANKGREAAAACFETANTLAQIKGKANERT